MTLQYACKDCTAQFRTDDDADTHADNTDHTVVEQPPQNASERELRARGFDPEPEPTEGHVSVVDGKRVGRRRADY